MNRTPRLRIAALALVCLLGVVASAHATTGYTIVSAAHLQDATGTLIANATISFQPVSNSGAPIAFRAGGAGGQAIGYPVSTLVTNGVFSIQLADTTLTSPVNVCYAVILVNNVSGRQMPFPGYSCIQPSGATWSLDTYTPSIAALPLQLSGCSIAIGTVAALAAGATPTVANSGTSCAATLNFGIPAGSGSGSSSFTLSVNGTAISTSATTITVNGVTL